VEWFTGIWGSGAGNEVRKVLFLAGWEETISSSFSFNNTRHSTTRESTQQKP